MAIIVRDGFQIGVLPERRVQLRTRTAAVPLSLSRRLCCSLAPAWQRWASMGGSVGTQNELQLFQDFSGFVRSGEVLAEFERVLKAFLGSGHVAVFLLGEAVVVLDDRIVWELLGRLFEQRHGFEI